MSSAQALPIHVDVVSDVVCPWCFIGKRRIEHAIALAPDVAVELAWRPFQLDATIPRQGLDRQEYMQRKFGSLEKVRSISERLTAEGEKEGIGFRFDRIKRSPNTLDAHRLIRWAGAADVQGAVVEALFTRFFIEGDDIGDAAVLKAVAAEAGMDADVVGELLAGDADVARVQEEIGHAAEGGVTGVPCFIFAERLAIPGAQEPATLARYMQRIAARIAGESVATANAPA
jgi:predicted DsbA family dithiol-disulfide isomerase